MAVFKCADCGLLTYRSRSTRELVGAEDGIRETGQIPSGGISSDRQAALSQMLTGSDQLYDELPICFVGAFDLKGECTSPPPRTSKDRLAIMQRDRDCGRFIKLRPELTPKEHIDMIQSERLMEWQKEREDADRRERAQRDLEARDERERDRQERAARDKDARDFQREQADVGRTHNRRSLWIALGGVGIALIGSVVSNGISLWKEMRRPAAPPVVNVQPPSVTVQPASVTVNPPTIKAPVVNIQPPPPAQVTIQPPNITINVPPSDSAKQPKPRAESKAANSK